jgi:zinc protease
MDARPVTPEEMRSAKDALINSLPGAFETGAAAVGNFANTFIYDLGLDYYANYAEEVRAVTPAQTIAVTKKYLTPQSLIVVAVGDRKAIEPELQKLNLGTIEIRDAEGNVTK